MFKYKGRKRNITRYDASKYIPKASVFCLQLVKLGFSLEATLRNSQSSKLATIILYLANFSPDMTIPRNRTNKRVLDE